MSNLNDRLVKGLLTRANTRLDEANGGGGEIWENVPFKELSISNSYHTVTVNRADILNSFIRVTVQAYATADSVGQGAIISPIFKIDLEKAFSAPLYVATNSVKGANFSGSVYNAGSAEIDKIIIAYSYGMLIDTAADRPKILKIERLV